jgi:hypothetical protein
MFYNCYGYYRNHQVLAILAIAIRYNHIILDTGFQLLRYATKVFALLAQQKTTCIPQKADKPLLFSPSLLKESILIEKEN